jgi:hypothetical protein
MTPRTQKILASVEKQGKFPYLIEISHPDYNTMYFANSSENIVYNTNIYNSASFSIQPPDKDGSKIGSAALTISAIDQFWIERIRAITTPAELRFAAVIVYDEQGGMAGIESLEENNFTCRLANWNEISISWDLSFDERMGFIITSVKCTPMTAPGCA